MAERNFEVTSSIFLKTKKCRFFGMGKCDRGSKCNFAHSLDDLRRAPDLRRTKMCPTYVSTGACSDPMCTYAHNSDERRKMTGRARPSRNVPLAEGPVDAESVDWGKPDSPHASWKRTSKFGRATNQEDVPSEIPWNQLAAQDCVEPGAHNGTQSPQVLKDTVAAFGYPVQDLTAQNFLYTYSVDVCTQYGFYSVQPTFDYYGEQWQDEKFDTTPSPSTATLATVEIPQQESKPDQYEEKKLRVHNTFFTDEEPDVPLKHRLRRVRSEDILTADKDVIVEDTDSLLTLLATIKACKLEDDLWCRSASC